MRQSSLDQFSAVLGVAIHSAIERPAVRTVNNLGHAPYLEKHGPQHGASERRMQMNDVRATLAYELIKPLCKTKRVPHTAGAVVECNNFNTRNWPQEVALAFRDYRGDRPRTKALTLHSQQVTQICCDAAPAGFRRVDDLELAGGINRRVRIRHNSFVVSRSIYHVQPTGV